MKTEHESNLTLCPADFWVIFRKNHYSDNTLIFELKLELINKLYRWFDRYWSKMNSVKNENINLFFHNNWLLLFLTNKLKIRLARFRTITWLVEKLCNIWFLEKQHRLFGSINTLFRRFLTLISFTIYAQEKVII